MSEDNFRDKGKEIIGGYVSIEKNIDILEKNLFNYFESRYDPEDEGSYFDLVYEVCSLLEENSLKTVNEMLKKGEIMWDSELFYEEREKQTERDEFLLNPFQVEEGVNKCDKCGSSKVYSVSKQVRAADEGFSTFCLCLNCKAQWRNN
jgi:DNA-directed RNA polymerase subunit M/transcription elongation factor TFIIS